MGYEVIARKWRPRSFGELVGQGHVSQTLLNALKSARLPHALLLTGPRGTGKTSTARILAKTLRCQNQTDYTPCNTCSDCTEINESSSMDVIEIDGASNNGVDAIRELRDTVSYMPSSGQHKVYIIDEVHMLSTSAFNALLKTLEEPPGHVIFVMATTEVHKIPNTILSRVQRFDFRKISLREVSKQLAKICNEEGVKAAEEALWVIARQGEGSMRDSLSLLDQVITYSNKDITLESTAEILGLTDRQLLLQALTALVHRDSGEVLNAIQTLLESGVEASLFVKDLLEEVRHLLMVKVAPDRCADLVDLPDSEIKNLSELGQSLSEEDVHLMFDMTLKGAGEIQRASDPQLVLEVLLLRLASAPKITELKSLLQGGTARVAADQAKKQPLPNKVKTQPAAITHSPDPGPQTPPQKPFAQAASAPVPVKAAASARPAAGSRNWDDFVDRVKKVNGLVGAKLEHTYLINLQNDNLELGVPAKMKFIYEQINDDDFHRKVANYLNTFWGQSFKISIQLADEKKKILTPKQNQEIKRAAEQKQTREAVENHPAIKEARVLFKSEIVGINELAQPNGTP